MKYTDVRHRVATRVCNTIQAHTDGNVAEPEYRPDNFDMRQILYNNFSEDILFKTSKRYWLCSRRTSGSRSTRVGDRDMERDMERKRRAAIMNIRDII